VLADEPAAGAADRRDVEAIAQMRGEAEAARVRNAVGVAEDEVGIRAQLLARREQRRQLAEREQSGHVWKGRMPDRRCSGDDLEGREG